MKVKTAKSKGMKLVKFTTSANGVKVKDGTIAKVHSFNYSTTVNNFEITYLNRGEEKGYKDKKVKAMKLLLNPNVTNKVDYLWEYSPIKVLRRLNGTLWVLDGNNRIMSIKMLIKEKILPKDFQIPFTIITDPKLNSLTKKELIGVMADLNDQDNRWSEAEHFKSAFKVGYKTANIFNEYIGLIKSESITSRLNYQTKTGVRPVTVKLNVILALAKRTTLTGNKAVRFADFRDDNVAAYMGTDDFNDDFNSLIDLLEYIKNWTTLYNVRASKVYTPIFNLMFGKDIRFKLSKIVSVMKVTSFNGGNINDYLSEVVQKITKNI